MCEACSHDVKSCPITELAHELAEFAREQIGLTTQQVGVMISVLEDRTVEHTAARLGIQPRTVRYHERNIFRAIGVRTRMQMAMRVAAQLRLSTDNIVSRSQKTEPLGSDVRGRSAPGELR